MFDRNNSKNYIFEMTYQKWITPLSQTNYTFNTFYYS